MTRRQTKHPQDSGRADVLAKFYPLGEAYDASSADAALMLHLAFWTGLWLRLPLW